MVAEAGCGVCLMHMQGVPKTMQDDPHYDDVVGEVLAFLEERLRWAVAHGVREEQICLDPGIGFGKTRRAQPAAAQALATASRRSDGRSCSAPRASAFSGRCCDAEPTSASSATAATTVAGALAGAAIFRVHDVKPNREALRVALAVLEAGEDWRSLSRPHKEGRHVRASSPSRSRASSCGVTAA